MSNLTVYQKVTYSYKSSGCGSVGRTVASDTRGPQFESSHWQLYWKDEKLTYSFEMTLQNKVAERLPLDTSLNAVCKPLEETKRAAICSRKLRYYQIIPFYRLGEIPALLSSSNSSSFLGKLWRMNPVSVTDFEVRADSINLWRYSIGTRR